MAYEEVVSERLYMWLLNRKTKKELLEIMLGALDNMNMSNLQSHTACICDAAGFEEKDDGSWIYPKEKTRVKKSHC